MIRLTHCKRANHAGEYFERHLQSGDSPSHPAAPAFTLKPAWIGPALAEVKIAPFEPPTARHLVRMARGLHPSANKRLALSSHRKRAYYDVMVAPPKTISLAALLEPNHPVARSVMHAHISAVEAVAKAAGGMIQPQNAKGAPTEKWLGVMFHHTHTRENDPHLHSHLVFPNLMRNRDGQWRAMQVVIAGENRLKLELVYGHDLAVNLRRLGFGPVMVMRSNGLPEIEALLGLARSFSKASRAILAADLAAQRGAPREQPAKEGAGRKRQQGRVPRVFTAGFYDDERLNRRRRLADRLRRPKPRTADDPVKLTHEADRWKQEISNADHRRLTDLLDGLDWTDSRRRVVPLREPPPPNAFEIVRAVARNLPEGTKTTAPVVFRRAVVLSAGRHPWDDLMVEARAKIKRHKALLARIRAQWEEMSVAEAQAQIEAANQRAHAAPRPTTRPGTGGTPAPSPAATPTPPLGSAEGSSRTPTAPPTTPPLPTPLSAFLPAKPGARATGRKVR